MQTPSTTGKLSVMIAIAMVLCAFWACGNPDHDSSPSAVPASQRELVPEWYNVAFLVMDGVYNTELTAPLDIFHHTKFREGIRPMNVFLVSEERKPIKTFEGLLIEPDFTFGDTALPSIDILVVPSAEHHLDSDLQNENMLDFVRTAGSEASYVMSLCDGAFVLASALLPDGTTCTTFPADINTLRERFPNLNVVDSVLVVHDSKYITSAGGARSFDAALYLTELLYGREIARKLAEGLVIDWNFDAVPHYIVPAD